MTSGRRGRNCLKRPDDATAAPAAVKQNEVRAQPLQSYQPQYQPPTQYQAQKQHQPQTQYQAQKQHQPQTQYQAQKQYQPQTQYQPEPVTTHSVDGTGNRRQRRRQRNKDLQQQESLEDSSPSQQQFDENAYLSGQVKVVSDSVNSPPRRPMTQLSIDLSSSSQPVREEEPEKPRHFDEQAFLSGRVAILSEEPKGWSPKQTEFHETAPWEREAEEIESRRSKLFEEEPFRRKDPVGRERAPWEKDNPDGGRPELAELYNNRGNVSRERAPWEKEEDTGRTELAELYQQKEVAKEPAPWEKRKNEISNGNDFDENIFLRRTSIDIPPPFEDPTESNGQDYNEQDFLQGKIPIVSGNTDGTAALQSSTQYKKPSTYRERAPWEKPEEGEGGGFDEKEFLMGRVPLVGSRDQAPAGRFSKIPSKAFQRLTRSMSREVSPSLDTTSDYLSSDDVDDYQSDSGSSRGRGGDMRYKGNYIPSKTFHKLRRSMDRRSAEPDQNFQQGPYNMEDDYVSDAVEEVTIENNDPETYLENLKQSMQSNPVRIEPQAEATDF